VHGGAAQVVDRSVVDDPEQMLRNASCETSSAPLRVPTIRYASENAAEAWRS
jgi:hypothetical protein